jgi:hypothetical protein
MATRKALVAFAVLALGAGVTASIATALSPCSHRACSDEVASSGLSGQARGACVKPVIADCRAGRCSCTGGSPPCSCVCGDTLCGPSEDCSTCPQDCGPCRCNGSERDCPAASGQSGGQACLLAGIDLCTAECNVPNVTPCNGGCCSAALFGTCQPGTADTACGNTGVTCVNCTSSFASCVNGTCVP